MNFAIAATLALFPQAAGRETAFRVPSGFVVERPSALSGSLISLTFGPEGSAYVGREDQGIVRLFDSDGDGRFEGTEDIAPDLTVCQGMLVDGSALFANAVRGKEIGLWRVPLDEHGRRAGELERLFEYTDGGEHGPHGIVRGHDGSVYVTVGNHAAFSDAASRARPYWAGDEGRLLAPYMDPLGHGTHVRYPGGFVARVDLKARTWEYVAVGLRNVYDVAIDLRGFRYAVDSDMEWDVGLPWYRPVRLLEVIEGADYGSRAGSAAIPAWCVDTQAALLDLGRGSPTGAVFGTDARFPSEWRWPMYCGDWAQGKIFALWTGEDFSGVERRSVEFLSADGALPVTDLDIGPEGGLWFLTGGRGTQGGVYRVVHPGQGAEQLPNIGRDTFAREGSELAARTAIAGHGGDIAGLVDWAGTLGASDRTTWPLELRLSALLAGDKDIDRASRAPSLETRVGALFLLAPTERIAGRADRIAEVGLGCLDALVQGPQPHAELTLAILRALELGLLRQGDPRAELANALAAKLLGMFPAEDARVGGQIAVLLAHLDDPRALLPILDQMSSSPQELAIHYADCAHRMTRGWDRERRKTMLEWFARSSAYSGGISLPGYLTAMRAHFIRGLSAQACGELVPQEGLDAESLALLFARLPPETATEHFPRFEAALARIVPRSFGTPEQASKDAALRALEPLALPEVQDLARRLALSEGDVLEAPWTLLARAADPRDFDLWLGAIVSPSQQKRDSAFAALSRLDRLPRDAEEWRSMIDHARELGSRRGRELTRTLARWCSALGGVAVQDDLSQAAQFDAALLALNQWHAAQFPGAAGPASLDPIPHWSEAQMLAFISRASVRAGSAAHGRIVFESAGCNACHAIGATPATDRRGFGPDLANVADRLSDADLLAAIVAPSRVVSDQYRASIAITRDERMFEGIVIRRGPEGVVIQPVGAEPIEIDADELESLAPSPRSTMPEGLLEMRTLEELRDLFAYLKSPTQALPSSAWAPLLGAAGVPGWDGDGAVWSLRKSTLLGRSSGLARSSYLLAPMPAQDLWIEFDVFLPPGANSGFCYRAARPADPRSSDPTGAQADLGQSFWGSLYIDQRGTVVSADREGLEAALDRKGWNHVLVRVEGDLHAMEINGVLTYSVREAVSAGPLFGFQVHQGKPMLVRIANARWRSP